MGQILEYCPKIKKQARVHNKLRFMNSPKGSLMGDDLNIMYMLKSRCIPKISPLACLIMEIAMKKTLKLGF